MGRVKVCITPGDGVPGLARVLLTGVRFGRISLDQPGDPARSLTPDDGNFWRLVQDRPERAPRPHVGQ
jgi:hypothetical protein